MDALHAVPKMHHQTGDTGISGFFKDLMSTSKKQMWDMFNPLRTAIKNRQAPGNEPPWSNPSTSQAAILSCSRGQPGRSDQDKCSEATSSESDVGLCSNSEEEDLSFKDSSTLKRPHGYES